MDFCFGEILEAITNLNDVKGGHLKELHWLCMLSKRPRAELRSIVEEGQQHEQQDVQDG